MVRLALVGCGRIAQLVHLPVLCRIAGAKLVALADQSPEHLRQAQRYAPGAALYGDHRDLLARSDAEAVVLALPPFLHAEAAIAAFEAGKHAYLEKPGAMTHAQARGVLEAWRAAGTVGMVGLNQRFHPAYHALRTALREGHIGEVVGIRSVLCAAARDLPDWKQKRGSGGGVFFDLAIHHIDLLRFLFAAEIKAVSAQVRSVCSEDDSATLSLRLASGALAQCFVSMSAVEHDRFEVYGTAGRLAVERYGAGHLEFTPPKAVRGRVAHLRRLLANISHGLRGIGRPTRDRSHARALESFVEAVRRRDPAQVPGLDDAFASLTIVLAAEQSARSGEPWLAPKSLNEIPLARYDAEALALSN